MQESSDTTYANRKMTLKMEHIAVVFNEPTITTEKGRMFISAEGQVGALASHSEIVSNMSNHLVDMSEVGVIEEREQVEKSTSAQRVSHFTF